MERWHAPGCVGRERTALVPIRAAYEVVRAPVGMPSVLWMRGGGDRRFGSRVLTRHENVRWAVWHQVLAGWEY